MTTLKEPAQQKGRLKNRATFNRQSMGNLSNRRDVVKLSGIGNDSSKTVLDTFQSNIIVFNS